jgi:hypothetical protein
VEAVPSKAAPTNGYGGSAASLWDQVLAQLRQVVQPQTFNTWFKPTRGIAFSGGRLRVEVPNETFRGWIEERYRAHITGALARLGRASVTVDLIYPETPATQVGPSIVDVVGQHDAGLVARRFSKEKVAQLAADYHAHDYTTFRVSSGLLAHEHLKAMGEALALFLWCVDRQTGPHGLILGGKPVTLAQIAERLPYSDRQLARQLARLGTHGYITVERRQRGLSIQVNNQKKFGPRHRPREADL